MSAYIGCAGWSIPAQFADRFPESGSHLERYAARFNCVEINSSFYRPHQRKTYQRWASTTPPGFRFSVKLPRQITHHSRLIGTELQIEKFLESVMGLEEKLGPVLIQLPPSLNFDPAVARPFFTTLRNGGQFQLACEPRHPTWFTPEAAEIMKEFAVARVAADPSCVPEAFIPAGSREIKYWRMHGSPQIYYSEYQPDQLEKLAEHINEGESTETTSWCIFDNTALGFATVNALQLADFLVNGG